MFVSLAFALLYFVIVNMSVSKSELEESNMPKLAWLNHLSCFCSLLLKQQIHHMMLLSKTIPRSRIPRPIKDVFTFTIPYQVTIFATNEQQDSNPNSEDYQHEQGPEEEEEELETALVRRGTEIVIDEIKQALMKLPLDVFLEIISRLPIKSLAICRCVCKTWLKIVHHPRFTKMHHTKAMQFHYHTSLVFNFQYSTWKYDQRRESFQYQEPVQFHFLEHENDDSFHNGVIVKPPFCITNNLRLVGSCNGLLCVADHYSYNTIYIWNPVTGEYTILPAAHRGNGNFYHVCGLGFDQVSNKYKVILMSMKNRGVEGQINYKMDGQIYTLGSNEWRRLVDVPYPIRNRSSMFLNGAFHWPTDYSYVRSTVSDHIVSFDVGSEEFRIVPSPPGYNPRTEHYNTKLVDLGGCLSMFNMSSRNEVEIWVMKDYGVQGSWTKEYVISGELGRYDVLSRPITMTKNGNILMVLNHESLVSYEAATGSYEEIGRILPKARYMLDAITHVGSFISLRDIIQTRNGKHSVSTGRWYRDLHLIHSPAVSSAS